MRQEMKKSKKLELTWPGKEIWEKPEPRLLLEKNSYGTNKGSEENMLIYGDNLLGLKALEKDFTGKVKCIYIDPPYNTKSCFTHYDDNMEHSMWLNMMKDRLVIMHRLLSEDGSIWISIDDCECHYLKVMCDEIFGRTNFITTIIWEKMHTRKNSAKFFSSSHDHILCYSKNKNKWSRKLLKREDCSAYKNPDNDPRGNWKADPIHASKPYAANYTIKKPNGKVIERPNGRYWRYSEESIKRFIQEERIIWGKENSTPMAKRFLNEAQDGLVPTTIWFKEEVGHNSEAKSETKTINNKEIFQTPKPERLIQRILHIASNPGDLVLDSFSGSGTTGAVAHKMRRRWIMIEFNGPCHTHIIPRLQKVVDGTDKGGITEAVDWEGGGGFRYCELAPSLLEKNKFNRWTISKKYNPEMLIKAMCLHSGYTFNPRREPWWMHGQSTENDFIFVTASTLTRTQLLQMSHELGEDQSLLVFCGAFKPDPNEFENLTIKKIPKSILNKCEWGRDDYSLKIALQKEVKEANKRKPIKQETSGYIARVPIAAQGGRS